MNSVNKLYKNIYQLIRLQFQKILLLGSIIAFEIFCVVLKVDVLLEFCLLKTPRWKEYINYFLSDS